MARRRKLDTLGRIMSKIRKGLKLTKRERKILSAAIDASKKARSEYGRRRTKRNKKKHDKKKTKK